MAQLYRLWSRVVCRQILSHLSRYMPADLTGLLIGRGALDATMRQQYTIECAHKSGNSIAGLCLDLIKCYNTVNRPRVMTLLIQLGIPPAIVDVWYFSLQKLCRVWIIQGRCSTLTPTCNGIPEGDSFSVVCMIALDYLWATLARRPGDTVELSAYADNLSWSASLTQDHAHVVDATLSFCQCTGMSVDWLKTWTWGTTPAVLQALQEVLHAKLPQIRIAAKRSAMDLGSQMTYAGPPLLGKLRNRLDKAKQRLLRLANLDLPLKSKSHLVRGGAYPVAFFGVALTPIGEQHVDGLRSATATALLGHSQSRNSALAIVASPDCLDPLEYAILTALRAVRRFLLHLDAADQNTFFSMAACHDGSAIHCRGPAGVLKFWIMKLGWIIDRQGFLHIQPGVHIHLLNSGIGALTQWVRRAWQVEVMDQHCKRAALRHLHFDFSATRQVIRSFPKKQHAALIQELSGAFQTEAQKSSWASDSTGLCLHCGEPDSREHRLLSCAATQDAREPFMPLVRHIEQEGLLLYELPAIPLQTEEDVLLACHLQMPEAEVEGAILGRLHQLIHQGFCPEIYTDGSLQYSSDTVARYAAYGLIWDSCVLPSQRDEVIHRWKTQQCVPTNFVPLACARTTGAQTIHRSELYALVRTCELLPRAAIFSDSASALTTAAKCLEARSLAVLVNLQDFDLVKRLWVATRSGGHVFHKVPAHVKPDDCHDPVACYRAWGNHFADDLAVTTCTHLYPDVVKAAEALHCTVAEDKKLLSQVFQLHLVLHTARAKLDQARTQATRSTEVLPTRSLTPMQCLQQWTVPHPWIPCRNQHGQIGLSPWGLSLSNLLVSWMHSCVWPHPDHPQHDDPGVTWHELYISWVMYSHHLVPVKRPDAAGSDFLQCLDSAADVDRFQVSMAEQVRLFSTWLNQMLKLVGYEIWPVVKKGMAKSLYRLGSSAFHMGFLVRPTLPHQSEVVALLAGYVRAHSNFDALPTLQIQPIPAAAKDEMRGKWNQLIKKTTAAIANVKKSRAENSASIRDMFSGASSEAGAVGWWRTTPVGFCFIHCATALGVYLRPTLAPSSRARELFAHEKKDIF